MYVDKSHYDDQGKLYHNASAYCLMYVDKSHYEDQGKLQSSPFIMPPFVLILSIFIVPPLQQNQGTFVCQSVCLSIRHKNFKIFNPAHIL